MIVALLLNHVLDLIGIFMLLRATYHLTKGRFGFESWKRSFF